MRLTQDIIRKIIKEEISKSLTELDKGKMRTNAIATISNLMMKLDAEKMDARRIVQDAIKQYETSDETADEMTERKLTPAEEKERERIAAAMEEEDPDIDMGTKMAMATAQAKKSA